MYRQVHIDWSHPYSIFIKGARDEAPLTTIFKLVQYLLYSTRTWGKCLKRGKCLEKYLKKRKVPEKVPKRRKREESPDRLAHHKQTDTAPPLHRTSQGLAWHPYFTSHSSASSSTSSTDHSPHPPQKLHLLALDPIC